MSIPVHVNRGSLPKKEVLISSIPISRPTQRNANNLHLKSERLSSPNSWFDRNSDDLLSRYEDPLSVRRLGNSDRWFDDMHRRLDDRRKRWDDEMEQMKNDFFKPFSQKSPAPIEPYSSSTSPPSSYAVTTQFDRDEEGLLHFSAQFDTRDFGQDNVKVAIREGQIIVTAKTDSRSGTSTTSRQFTRSVDLPKGVQETEISAAMTADGILEVDCPIQPLRVQSPAFSGSSTSRTSDMRTPSSVGPASRFSGNLSPVPQSISQNLAGKLSSFPPKFHIEIPIGTDYKPDEIQIRTLNNRIYITAKHGERVQNKNTFREFSKEYDIPDRIDPTSVNARLEEGILHLEGAA